MVTLKQQPLDDEPIRDVLLSTALVCFMLKQP